MFRLFLALLLAVAPAAPASAEEACPDDARWGMVIDAGSSGSRLRLYCWRPGDGDALPWIEARGGKKQEPGVADAECSRAPEESVALLRPLIDHARETIDEARWASTPLSLLATAGLRQCPESYRAEMLAGIRAYLEENPFELVGVEVISGLEEGRFGWAGVNYLLGGLDPGAESTGALDLGGASTQMTFAAAECSATTADCGEIELGEASYPAYSHSYLGWGQDDAMRRVGSPACYLRGYPQTEQGTTGRGRFKACRRAIRRAIAREMRARPPEPPCESSCNRLGAYQPSLAGDFVAFSAYAYTTDYLELPPRLSLAELAAAGKSFCKTPWRQIEAECAAGTRSTCNESWLNRYCFASAYIVTLLHDVYGFGMGERQITSTNELEGVDIDWTLGVMVQMAQSP
ncbi:MAG: hypothetical protein GY719_13705 [bacterium]|nr:hypothetical protein [bacterium]